MRLPGLPDRAGGLPRRQPSATAPPLVLQTFDRFPVHLNTAFPTQLYGLTAFFSDVFHSIFRFIRSDLLSITIMLGKKAEQP